MKILLLETVGSSVTVKSTDTKHRRPAAVAAAAADDDTPTARY